MSVEVHFVSLLSELRMGIQPVKFVPAN